MQKWVEGTVVGQTRWTAQLYSLKVEAGLAPFEAGQFAKLALPAIESAADPVVSGVADSVADSVADDKVARPYSFVNAPGESPHEFYYVIVPGGPLTARLAALGPGDRIFLAPRASGFLVLSEVPAADTLWLLATGTGIGPFLSILKTPLPWQRYRKVVLAHGVREIGELSYRDEIERLKSAHPAQFEALSLVSGADATQGERQGAERRPAPLLTGRITRAIADGRLEQAAGAVLRSADSQVMICGNPAMVTDTTEMLKQRGMKKHRRRDPGQITVENYW
ncbi:MAG: ferredoxin--NADP reductase [Betaproteobacteria bacterium]|nr:ferredoxin--NADP reductase [Betaproteobacteria bacterium]